MAWPWDWVYCPEVQDVFPEFVSRVVTVLDDGTVVEKVLSPDTYGVAAALHHEAILALMEVEDLKKGQSCTLEADEATAHRKQNGRDILPE
jgi:hypothetical protein